MKTRTLLVAAMVLSSCGAQAVGVAQPTLTSPNSLEPPTRGSTTTASPTTGPMSPSGDLADVAVVSADGRVVVVRKSSVSAPLTGLIAADNTTLITTAVDPSGKSTSVAWLGLSDGVERGRVSLGGHLTAIATDLTGEVVALTEANPPSGSATEIVIATAGGEVFRRSYASELLPEGFSNFSSAIPNVPAGLFVVEYLEPRPSALDAPRRYQVRVLDTSTGDLALPLNLRDKGQNVDEQMLGFGRSHVLSPHNGLLFTLYRGVDKDEANYAFVHTLGFINGVWCLDLPVELGLATLPGAIALVDGEKRLVVASANGYMSEFVIDDITNPEQKPAPRRTAKVWRADVNASAPAVSANATQILVGQHDSLRWIDADTLTVHSEQQWGTQIEAVSLMPNGDAIATGAGRISEVTSTGALVAEMALPPSFGTVWRIVPLGHT
jgi:hypothetical protein